jgi:hypothetical protein
MQVNPKFAHIEWKHPDECENCVVLGPQRSIAGKVVWLYCLICDARTARCEPECRCECCEDPQKVTRALKEFCYDMP